MCFGCVVIKIVCKLFFGDLKVRVIVFWDIFWFIKGVVYCLSEF